jgi:hypothetical protein
MNLLLKRYAALFLWTILLVISPTLLFAETATFDGLSEGVIGNEITDGGITFFDLDNGQPGLDNVFIIEQADASLSGSEFSAPNGLTATGFTPGADVGYGAIKELSMTTGGDADSASIDVFLTGELLYANTITLEALKEDAVVDSTSIFVGDIVDGHVTLTTSGIVFDTLRLASSPDSQGLLLDNVTINTIAIDTCECDLNQDGVCDMLDWQLFGQNWGRTDCLGNADVCECDLNQDGVCDMLDWQLFGQDWGRTDCP